MHPKPFPTRIVSVICNSPKQFSFHLYEKNLEDHKMWLLENKQILVAP